jgi:hypothetical protein
MQPRLLSNECAGLHVGPLRGLVYLCDAGMFRGMQGSHVCYSNDCAGLHVDPHRNQVSL